MKFSMFITETDTQINLTPENDHEKHYIAVLRGAENKTVTVKTGVDIGMCQGGYVRNFGEKSQSVVFVLRGDRGDRDNE